MYIWPQVNPAAKTSFGVLVATAALAAVAFANALQGALVWDDALLIERNQALSSWVALGQAWWQPFWSSASDSDSMREMTGVAYYRPLVHVLLFAVHVISGSSPWPFHLLTVAGHVLASVLVAGVALRLFGDWRAGLVAGALFATHPIHSESVAWVSGLSDVYMTVFALWAVLVAVDRVRWSWARAAAVCGVIIAACLTKEPGAVAGLVVLISAWRSVDWRQRVSAVAVAALVVVGLRSVALSGVNVPVNHAELGVSGWVLQGFALLGQAVVSMIAPVQLNAYHLMAKVDESLWPAVVGGVMAFGALVAACKWAWPTVFRLPVVLLFASLLPAMIVPRLGPNAFAERYLYLPSVGLTLIIGGAMVGLEKRARLAAMIAVALAVIFGARATIERNRVWASDLTLFTDIARQSPECPILTENLSQAYLEAGRPRDALALLSGRAHLKVTEELNLGIAQAATKHLPEAAATFHDALARLEAKGANAAVTQGLLLTNLCLVEQNLGQLEAAVATCGRAVAKVPFIAQAAAVHSRALMLAGRRDEARSEANRAFELDPANGPAKTMRERLR